MGNSRDEANRILGLTCLVLNKENYFGLTISYMHPGRLTFVLNRPEHQILAPIPMGDNFLLSIDFSDLNCFNFDVLM